MRSGPRQVHDPRPRHRGMTLVEIMVVIAILGTLMAVVAFGVTSKMDDANVETTKIQIRNIEQGLKLYQAKNNGRNRVEVATGLRRPSAQLARQLW